MSVQFCDLCANLLYPKEDKIHKVLMYACRNCNYSQEATEPLVFKQDLIVVARETAGVTQDLETDPTLPRSSMPCPNPKCGNQEAVFFQGSSKRSAETKMTLFYVCTRCHEVFQDKALEGKRR